MQALFLLLCLMVGTAKCSKKHEKAIGPSPRKAELQALFTEKLAESKLGRSKDGWLATDHCDAMLWTGKYSCAADGVNILAAEYPLQPGRFNRRPAPFCEVDAGSKTSWSRDMGMGLFTHALCNKDLAALERHASYGTSKQWKMGEPLDDGRVVYTPSVIGHLYQLIFTLGGEDNANRVWPSIYSEGLTDYEAHLQMMDIWLRGELANKTTLADSSDAISSIMFDRIKEHVAREPTCPMFTMLNGVYNSGELNTTIDLLLDTTWTCTYLHTDDRTSQVFLAEWLFVASQVIKKI